MIKYIQILGERNSGTNYLASLLSKNIPTIEIVNSFGFKHWFIKDHYPRSAPNNSTDFECSRSLEQSDDTLFLVITRNPFNWLQSMAINPYHAPDHMGLDFSEFIRKPWACYEPARANSKWPVSDDGIYYIEEAENILALRSMKIQHWLNLRQRVKNIAFINYESLYANLNTLENIAARFDLASATKPFVNENGYLKGGALKGENFVAKKYQRIAKHDLEFIKNAADWDIERSVNYHFSEYVDQV